MPMAAGLNEAAEREQIPAGYEAVDPRTARRVPLTLSLRAGVPSYPGDPVFTYDSGFVDTRASDHDGGFLLERITNLGTHTASHVSAPMHVVIGGAGLAEVDEGFSLMPIAVLDVRRRIARYGPRFQVQVADLRRWERRHGRLPERGCVLLLTGHALLFGVGAGEESPYVTTPVPGLAGTAVDWMFEQRRIVAIGSDTLGPDATDDADLQATTSALRHGGITLENVGPRLTEMRPHGDWIAVNGNRPAFSGFPMGFTGFTVHR
jgi:kynurenine formamidase